MDAPLTRVEDPLSDLSADERALVAHYRMLKSQGRGSIYLELDDSARFSKYRVEFGGNVSLMNTLLTISGASVQVGQREYSA